VKLAERAATFGIWEMDLATNIVKGSEAWAALERVKDANVGVHREQRVAYARAVDSCRFFVLDACAIPACIFERRRLVPDYLHRIRIS